MTEIDAYNNKPVAQSNYFTTARYDYTAGEKRILYRIAEQAFKFREKNREYFDQHDGEYKVTNHEVFTMNIADFMSPAQKTRMTGSDYTEVIESFKSLVEKRISFDGNDSFSFGGILNFADKNTGDGTVTFMVHKFVWKAALDFTKGFTKLDLGVALQLKSPHAMRFYELCRQWRDKPAFTYSVSELRQMFGCTDKYPRMESFRRCVLDVAMKELEEGISPVYFTYTCNKVGHSIKTITFVSHSKQSHEIDNQKQNELLSRYSILGLNTELKRWLKNKMKFSNDQIKRNVKVLYEITQCFPHTWIDEMEESFQFVTRLGKRPEENPGLFIDNLKLKLRIVKDSDTQDTE